MRETEYSEAAVEVLDILNHTDKEDVEKIPQSFIKFLTDISNKNYKPKFNHEYPINGLNLRKQTREILGFIYITWWASDEKRQNYKKQIRSQNTKKLVENYNSSDIFRNKVFNFEQNESKENTSLVEYKEEGLLKKIIKKILKIFGLKKEGSCNLNVK